MTEIKAFRGFQLPASGSYGKGWQILNSPPLPWALPPLLRGMVGGVGVGMLGCYSYHLLVATDGVAAVWASTWDRPHDLQGDAAMCSVTFERKTLACFLAMSTLAANSSACSLRRSAKATILRASAARASSLGNLQRISSSSVAASSCDRVASNFF